MPYSTVSVVIIKKEMKVIDNVNVKDIYRRCRMSRGAAGRRNVRLCHMQQRTVQFFRCALKVLMVEVR